MSPRDLCKNDYEPDLTEQKGNITRLSLFDADEIVNNAIKCCYRNGFSPFAVTVVDASGTVIV